MKKILLLLMIVLGSGNLSAQVSVTSTAGSSTSATYTTVKGAFDAINLGTHQGDINISLTADTAEAATATLNASGTGNANFTSLIIKPATGVTANIVGNVASAQTLKIFGSNVTIDGSNAVGGTTRNLTISNTATTAPQVISMGSAAVASPLLNVTIKNTNIINGTTTSSAVVVSDGAALAGYFRNITLANNSIQKSYIGIYFIAAIAVANGSGSFIIDNDFNATGANQIRLCGAYAQGTDGMTISRNNFSNFEATSAEIKRAIWLATAAINSTVSENNISNINYTGTAAGGVVGINVTSGNTGATGVNSNNIVSKNIITNLNSGGTTILAAINVSGVTAGVTLTQNNISLVKNTNTGGYGAEGLYLASTSTAAATVVTNNFISDISAVGFNGVGYLDNGYGIYVAGGNGYSIYNNTVNLTVSQTVTTGKPAAFIVGAALTANAIDLRNNIFVNNQAQTGDKFAIYSAAASTAFSNIDYNDYFTTGANLGFLTSARATLADIQAGFGGNTHSLTVSPVFASANDLHLSAVPANTALDNSGVYISTVTLDFDGNVRSATTPDMGGDEFSATLANPNVEAKVKTKVFPIPANDVVNFKSAELITSIEIYNSVGQMAFKKSINSNEGLLDIKNLPAGIYMAKIYAETKVETVKIIKR